VTQFDNGGARSIKLNVVYGESAENKAFFQSTPSGEINVSIVRPEVAAQLEIGKEFYVDFTPAIVT
jgi:hypothetical protein